MPLKDHLATLSRLLVKKEQTKLDDFFERLLFYIIAACHRKMLRRLKHTTLSKPFVKSLKGLQEVNIAETFSEQFGHPHNDAERAHDIKFLQTLLVVETFVTNPVSPPADPSADTPTAPLPEIQVPRLYALARTVVKALEAERECTFQLYTAETCNEIRDLVVRAIKCFEDSLLKLESFTSNTTAHFTPEDFITLLQCLHTTSTYGTLLLKFVQGSAIEPFFKHVESLLRSQNNHTQTEPPEFPGAPPDDPDLRAVQPYVIDKDNVLRPLWKSYRDWLRLLVVFFEATDILLAYVVQNGFKPITMYIVTVPQDPDLDCQLLPWKEVLTDKKLFPTSSLVGTAQEAKSNEAIIDYIEQSIRSAPATPPDGQDAITTITTPKLLRKIVRRLAVNALKQTPQDLAQYPFANKSAAILELIFGGSVDADRLQKMSGKGKFPCITPTDEQMLKEINKLLRELDGITDFFRTMDNIGNNFSGSLHCEACLASLVAPNALHGNKPIFQELAVSAPI